MLSLITAGLAPAIALLVFFYLRDEYDQEPMSSVMRCFIFGALLVFPIMFIQFALQEEGFIQSIFMEVFIQAALIEEFLKWFIVIIAVFNHEHFNGRYDGIVYATAVGLGFASAENVLYLLSNGLETAFLRAIFPVSSHALFGVVMGYYLGAAKFSKQKMKLLFFSLFIPFLLHSLYNLILLSQNSWVYYSIPFMIFLWLLGLRKVKKANQSQRAHLQKKMAS